MSGDQSYKSSHFIFQLHGERLINFNSWQFYDLFSKSAKIPLENSNKVLKYDASTLDPRLDIYYLYSGNVN